MNIFRIGLLLGIRQIQRASIWTNILIVFVMALTFLNLIAVSGILVGLIVGSERALQEMSLGDIIVTTKDNETTIIDTPAFTRVLDTIPEIKDYTVRYKEGAQVEANYKTRRDLSQDKNVISGSIVGIDPIKEDVVTGLSSTVVEGEYLNPNEDGYLLLGALTLDRYTAGFADITGSLENIYPGDTVRVTIGQNTKEFFVKGIINAKAGEVSRSIYIPERELRRLSNRATQDAEEIAIRLKVGTDAVVVKNALINSGLDEQAKIRTFSEALPKFLVDIKNTFNVLGTFIGSIGIVVASITIFIIIFINALARRRFIGILKGIGIDRKAIEIAYVIQAGVYALAGSLIGVVITYAVLIPYFDANPINFPFSDGILVAEPLGTLVRFITLFVITLLAGYIPAWMIARGNTLNAILGRK
jgi:putative ABC transport system permease protein